MSLFALIDVGALQRRGCSPTFDILLFFTGLGEVILWQLTQLSTARLPYYPHLQLRTRTLL
jgi:hypothetical protein